MSEPMLSPPVVVPIREEVSPTGKAVIPPALVPWVAALVTLAAGYQQLAPEFGISHPTVVGKLAGLVLGLGALFGVLSPGLRKQ
jgi:hypothetical protein